MNANWKSLGDVNRKIIASWPLAGIDNVSLLTDVKVQEIKPTETPILDAEPDVGAGVAGALRLAVSKGYLEKETASRPSASRFSHLAAQNYSIDDKAHQGYVFTHLLYRLFFLI